VPSAANWLPYIPIHLLQSQSKVPRVRYTAAEKRIKKAEKGKRKKEKEIKASCIRSDGGIHGLMILTYA